MNFNPMRVSIPTARATSSKSAPGALQISDTAWMDDTRCARNDLATNLDNCDDQMFICRIFSRGIQCAYTSTLVCDA